MTDIDAEIRKHQKERERAVTRLFGLLLEMVFIVGVPAGVAAFIMVRYDHREWGIVLLPLAFILSLGILIGRYRQVTARINAANEAIEALKNQQK